MMDILLLFPGFIVALIIVFCYECKIRRTEPMNKVHFYVARDKNSELFLYMGKPFRGICRFHEYKNGCIVTNDDDFHNFGLNKDDYVNLKWEDEPVEVFLNMED